MIRYQRLLILNGVLVFLLSAATVGVAENQGQGQGLSSETSSASEKEKSSLENQEGEEMTAEEGPVHHHHHKHPADSEERESAASATSKKEEEMAPTAGTEREEGSVAGEPRHHHHHEHATEADVRIEPPPAEEMEEHIHHEFEHEHHMMVMDAGGMVMNENKDEIPRDCPQLAGDVEITVRAGMKYAKEFPGTVFGYDQHEWKVEPCTRITVTFINEDDIRHQWMVHMLPKYLYPRGMFHLEVAGPGRRTGTFIVPSMEKTYFVHCDVAQHTEKGMKAQLKVGRGDEDFPSIPGKTAPNFPDPYEREFSWSTVGSCLGAGVAGLMLALAGWGHIQRKRAAVQEVKPPQPQVPTRETKPRKWWWPFS